MPAWHSEHMPTIPWHAFCLTLIATFCVDVTDSPMALFTSGSMVNSTRTLGLEATVAGDDAASTLRGKSENQGNTNQAHTYQHT
jgi:hypothetical protein